MKLGKVIISAAEGLKTNKIRSILTTLGIVIGITAIILLMSVGQSAQELILGQIRGLGSQTIFVQPGRDPQGPSDFAELFTDSIKDRDVEDVERIREVEMVSPLIYQVTPISSEFETKRNNVVGVNEHYYSILDLSLEEGSFISKEDVRQKNSVVVLGAKLKEDLFGLGSAIGQKLRIKNRIYRVAGVLEKKGSTVFVNADDSAFVPVSAARSYITGEDFYNGILVKAVSEGSINRAVENIKYELRDNHKIEEIDKDDFHVETQADALQTVKQITDILTILLVSIAAISLLVGGIGIMNIMLVSVTERTREIGLRKAIGATKADILKQFLTEAILLTGIGGVIGVLCGFLFSVLVSVVLNRFVTTGWVFIFPFSAAVLGLVVSSIVGIVFGLYPAYKGAQKHPIESLRYE